MATKNYNKVKKNLNICFMSRSLKVSLFFGLFCFILLSNGFGQLNTYLNNIQSDSNYYMIKNGMKPYLDSLKTTMDSISFYAGSGEYKEFKKFEKLWEPRVSPHGNFTKYFDAEYSYYMNQQGTYDYITDVPWHELGPNIVNQSNNNKGVGPVEFLTFFDGGTTDSTQYMLTGSLAGGLFFSNDYGSTWNKTGTDMWAQSGCSWAVFNPTNHNMWYASTAGNDGSESLWIGKTGGIFRTTDE